MRYWEKQLARKRSGSTCMLTLKQPSHRDTAA